MDEFKGLTKKQKYFIIKVFICAVVTLVLSGVFGLYIEILLLTELSYANNWLINLISLSEVTLFPKELNLDNNYRPVGSAIGIGIGMTIFAIAFVQFNKGRSDFGD